MGCTEYWWSRGKAPSVHKLVERAELRLNQRVSEQSTVRPNVAKLGTQIRTQMTGILETLKQDSSPDESLSAAFNELRASFIKLEEKLSIGSRAAYGELSGQLRSWHDKLKNSEPVSQEAFGMFTARTLFFLANELEVPAPILGS